MEWVSPYDPLPQQDLFHVSTAAEKALLGGVGGGKTLCGMHEGMYLMQDNPESDGCITSPTYPMLRDVILPLWESWVPERLYVYVKSDQRIIWKPTGRSIFLRSADRPGRLSGLNLAWAWLDEACILRSSEVWRILQARIRCVRARRRCLYTTTTPDGWNWLIQEFRKPGDRCLIKTRTKDNVHLPVEFEPNLRAAYGEEYAAQMLDAEILMLEGLAWPLFPSMHHILNEAHALQRIKYWIGGVDWGYSKPAALGVVGVDDVGGLWLWDEWYKLGKTRAQIAVEAKKLQRKYEAIKPFRAWYCDHDPEGERHLRSSENAPDETGVTITWPGLNVRLADKDVISGVAFIRSQLSPRLDGEPRFHVHPRCTNFLREVDGYSFPKEGAKQEQPVGKHGDHACDQLRYAGYSHSLEAGPLTTIKSDEKARRRGERELPY